MKRLFRYIIPLMFITVVVASCEYESVKPVEIDPDTELSFKADIIPIFNQSCNSSGCHGVGDFAPDLTEENAYSSLFANEMIDTVTPENSVLYESMNSGSMKTYSTAEATATILQWIEQGAKNN